MTETRLMSDEGWFQGIISDVLSKPDAKQMRLEAAELLTRVYRTLHAIRHVRDGLRGHSNYQHHLVMFSRLQVEGKNFSERLERWSRRWKAQAPDCAGVVKTLQFALKLETKRVFGQELAASAGLQRRGRRRRKMPPLHGPCAQFAFQLPATAAARWPRARRGAS